MQHRWEEYIYCIIFVKICFKFYYYKWPWEFVRAMFWLRCEESQIFTSIVFFDSTWQHTIRVACHLNAIWISFTNRNGHMEEERLPGRMPWERRRVTRDAGYFSWSNSLDTSSGEKRRGWDKRRGIIRFIQESNTESVSIIVYDLVFDDFIISNKQFQNTYVIVLGESRKGMGFDFGGGLGLCATPWTRPLAQKAHRNKVQRRLCTQSVAFISYYLVLNNFALNFKTRGSVFLFLSHPLEGGGRGDELRCWWGIRT